MNVIGAVINGVIGTVAMIAFIYGDWNPILKRVSMKSKRDAVMELLNP